MDVNTDEYQARVVFRPVPGIAFIRKPHLPIGRVQRVNRLAIAAEMRQPGDGNPFARAVFVVRQIDVRVAFEVAQLRRLLARHEPQVGAGRAFLRSHGS